MLTLTTDKKWTIILSAHQAINSPLQNMLDTERMFDSLEHRYHVHAIRAIEMYKNHLEYSFVVHTNSTNQMAEIRRMALNAYHQECVLVRHNRKHEIKLHHSNCENTLIGHHFNLSSGQLKNVFNYTILNGKDYYTVN